MPKKLRLEAWLTPEELAERAARAAAGVEQAWWQALGLVAAGSSAPAAGRELGFSGAAVRMWVQRYNREGPEVVADGRRQETERRRLLNEAQREELARRLRGPAPNGGPWDSRQVAELMGGWLGREVTRPVAWKYLRAAGYRPQPVERPGAEAPEARREARRHRREAAVPEGEGRASYPTDLSDEEWVVIAPLVDTVRRGAGRPCKWSKREILNGIFYAVRCGGAWRMLPHDLPPWKTVYHWFRNWRRDGTWVRINEVLRRAVRRQAGRQEEPTAGMMDSQSVKTTEKGGLADTTGGRRSRGVSATS